MTSSVILGNNLDILKTMEDESIDLIYLDPPFFSQKTHQSFSRNRDRKFSFRDIWSSDEEYAAFLFGRLVELHRVLRRSGSLYFHCDRSASYLARAILNEVFGVCNFRSEIIWHYRRWSNSRKGLLPSHQTIYLYSKSKNYTFNTMYEEYSPSTNVDQILQSRGRNHLNKSIYARDEAGGIISAKPKKGVPLGDVWDIPYLNPKAKERTGYPTQKPVLLLERIIKLSTEEGETVLDPFCGSGTTLVASELLNRNSIGIDISEEAVSLSQERVSAPLKTSSTLLELGRESYRQADSEILGLLQGIDCVPIHRNKGIDAILIEQIDQKPVPVRVQRDHESLFEAASKLSKAGRTKGAKVMLLVATQENIDLGFEFDLPNEIQVINSPALEISAKLSKSPTRTHL